MAELIVIDPMTRISGFLEIRAQVEQNTIIDTAIQGLLYRGFETMLRGRPPLDAIYFTERICGICSAAHSYASALALEDALHIYATANDTYLREIIHGFEFVQNHLRHFYIMNLPNYVKITSLPLVGNQKYNDYRLPDEVNRRLEEHYIAGIEYSRLAHEGQAVLGGKAPHNHGIFAGGVTADITAYKLEKIRNTIQRLLAFVSTAMQEDIDTIAEYYPDYFEKGISYPNFMSYGVFHHEEPEINFLSPGILVNGTAYELQRDKISEQIRYAWYQDVDSIDTVDLNKPDAYSFIKAPRYDGLPMETGPLARMLISGRYQGGHSCMDRNIARMLETELILNIMEHLTDRIELIPDSQRAFQIPISAEGSGFIDTTRGSLAHFISIKDKVIDHYNIITPSNWNLSPKDEQGNPGVIERALIKTIIEDMENPVEIGRIVRSFDPCVSCATHLLGRDKKDTVVEVSL
jgi:hydrogenase large subunit